MNKDKKCLQKNHRADKQDKLYPYSFNISDDLSNNNAKLPAVHATERYVVKSITYPNIEDKIKIKEP